MATLRTGVVLVLALSALAWPKLALPAALFVFLAWLSAPESPAPVRRRHRVALWTAAVASAIAVPIFLAREAVPGLVQGGTSAAGERAVSRLRDFLFVEDAVRRDARFDPDRDGVGSALLVGELTGELGMRGAARLVPPLLEGYPSVESTRTGTGVEMGGFWFTVCLPVAGGGFSSDPHARFDDEAAERRFVAYAWPSGHTPGLERAYFIDEHERILSAPSGPARRFGAEHSPPCDDALAPETRGDWSPWRGKKPRVGLPGEKPAHAP